MFVVCPLCTLCSHGGSARDQAWRAKTRKQLEPDTEPRAGIQATAPGCPLLGHTAWRLGPNVVRQLVSSLVTLVYSKRCPPSPDLSSATYLLVSTTLLVSSSQLDLALDGATAPGWALLGQTECRLRNICGFMGTVFVCVWVLSADASDQFCFYLHSTINGKLNSCMHRPKFVHRSLWQRCSAVFCAADEPSEAVWGPLLSGE